MNSSLRRNQNSRGMLHICLLLMLLAGLIGSQHNANAANPAAATPQPEVTVTEQGISLRWNIPEPSLTANAQGTLDVTIAGVERVDSPGEYRLPVVNLLVALPPQGTPTLRVEAQQSRTQGINAPLAVGERAGKFPDEPEPPAQPGPALQPVSLEEIGILRGVRLARLALRPVLPQDGSLQVFSYLEAYLDFNAPITPTPADGDVLIEQVMRSVVNPHQVQSTLFEPAVSQSTPELALADAPRAAVQVEKPGVYVITAAALSGLGLPVGSKSLQLTHAGQSVAYEILNSDGDNILDAGEEMRFYAQPRVQRYSTYDTYFISEGTPKLMTTRAAAPGATAGLTETEITFEQNLFYPFEDPIYGPIDAGRDGDRWMWAQLKSGDAATKEGNYTFDLGNVDPAKTASMTVYLNGFTNVTTLVNDHKVEILLNDTLLSMAIWEGKTARAQVVAIPVNKLKDTGNKLTLRLPLTTVDGVWLDAFKVRYATDSNVLGSSAALWGEASGTLTYTAYLNNAASAVLYDVSDPHTPVKLTGFTIPGSTSLQFQDATSGTAHAYLATSAPGLLTPRVSPALQPVPVQGAAYLVIYHPDFQAGANTLVARRNSQGIAAVSENVQAVFDAYGEGLPTPAAIRAYLQNVYDTWTKKPQYVLLVGDGTWDPKHYQNETPSFIPSYLQIIDRMGEYAADNRYVTLAGPDLIPDMLIGRLPVNSPQQLTDMINKIIAYEGNPGNEDWNSRGTLVADYPLPGDGDFDGISDTFFSQMKLVPFYRQKIYYKVNTLTGAATKAAIISAINGGTSILTFTGHASYHQWGGKIYSTIVNEILWHVSDIASLSNGRKLPVILEFACETSRFDNPWIDSSGYPVLDEAFVRKPNAGAVATFGPTSPGYPGSHEKLGVGFITNLQTGTATLGTAMLAAKEYLIAKDNTNSFLADTYTILGDPAVKIKLDFIDLSHDYLPVISR